MNHREDSIELRVTRPSFYPAGCQDPTYQQGHYFTGVDYNDARAKAEAEYPNERLTFKIFKVLIDGIWVRQ